MNLDNLRSVDNKTLFFFQSTFMLVFIIRKSEKFKNVRMYSKTVKTKIKNINIKTM